jgi:hypothetical protein
VLGLALTALLGCASRLDHELVTYLRGAPNKSIELESNSVIVMVVVIYEHVVVKEKAS